MRVSQVVLCEKCEECGYFGIQYCLKASQRQSSGENVEINAARPKVKG